MHLAGATVIRGFLGFGKSSHLHAEKILRLSMDLPMVIEIVDVPEKVNAFLPYLEPHDEQRPCQAGACTRNSTRLPKRGWFADFCFVHMSPRCFQ